MTWWERTHGDEEMLVAYFSMEFGLDARLPIYAGGLGVLAGDHLKSAADLGVPLVGVGLLYRHGYFRQRLDEHGRQTDWYAEADPESLGLVLEPVQVVVEVGGKRLTARVWRRDVGGVPLYLLDSDQASPALYGGEPKDRIRQEALLGIGGVRALTTLGLRPTVYHLNEGHASFALLERLALGQPFEQVRASTVFTTHTPVPAGNEVFDPELVRRELGAHVKRAGFEWGEFVDLGRTDSDGFGLTPLALRASAHANGVSALHGEVAREMWASLWPERALPDVPIGHVTNGVHPPTWISQELAALLREAGVEPAAPPGEAGWELAETMNHDDVREARATRKAALAARLGLDPALLTIGFARRFATYKRAGLLFTDAPRLAALPLQVVLAGKAHPADEDGKALLAEVVRATHDPRLGGRVVFLEDYDMDTARELVQGVDVWLNTPRRPLEASGTSGMKAALNGALNLSVLDGWWAEGYDPSIGWAIAGTGDADDAEALYRVLEHEAVPTYRDRPDDWLAMAKASIGRVGARFSSSRMVAEYAERFYLPAHRAVLAPTGA
jgi:glycogen phosphorylase